MALAIALIAIAVAIYAISLIPILQGFFTYFPPVVWMYFVPMALSTWGVLPAEHPLYSTLAKYALPMALILLTLSTDVKAIASIGLPGLLALLAGSLGVVLGSVVAFLMLSGWLPEDVWQGFVMLSASWIGGSANLVAMQQSLEVDPSLVGPVVVVDTVVGYSWLGLLIVLSAQQRGINKLLKADLTSLDQVEAQLIESSKDASLVSVRSISIMVGASLVAAFLARAFAESLPELGSPRIITATTWTILVSVSGGLLLSITRLGAAARRHQAPEYAYAALFLLLVTVGAQADLRAIANAPTFLLAGLVILTIHIVCLVLVCRMLRLPAFFFAVGSMCSIGGAVSGPIAAAAYRPALAPVGALLGVAGYVIGIYLPLGLAFLLSSLAT
ncbi:MAG: DUF819 family protein [Pseudomonadota bacterium]